jgi:chaperone modulatory protein CbpM
MQIEQTEGLWLHERYEFSLAELADLSGVSEADLREWVDEGVLQPLDPQSPQWSFSAERLVTVRMACRIRKDFDLEPDGVALVVSLLDRVHALEAEIRALRARQPKFIR